MAVAVALIVLGLLLVAAAVAIRARGGATGPLAARGTGIAGGLVTAAGALFAVVLAGHALDRVDAPVLATMIAHRSPGRTDAAETVSLYGGTGFTGGLAVGTAVVLFALGRRRWALVWVVGVAVGATLIRVLKITVQRPRPPVALRLALEETTSLPSGHALMSALGLGLTAAAVVALGRGAVRGLAVVLAVAGAIVVGTSRVYLGVHWTTDVVSGWCLGAAVATLCLTLVLVLDARADRRATTGARPAAPADR